MTKSTLKPQQGQFKAKKRTTRDYGNYKSKPETKPIDQLTEAELIEEGSRQPFAKHYKFQKTNKERFHWRKVHTNKKGPTGGLPKPPHGEIPSLLVVHVENKAKDKDFKTTHSFTVRKSEVPIAINTFFDGVSIKKAFFNNRPISVKSN